MTEKDLCPFTGKPCNKEKCPLWHKGEGTTGCNVEYCLFVHNQERLHERLRQK